VCSSDLATTDKKGKVIVHQTQLDKEPGTDSKALAKRCISKSEEVLGTFSERKGTVMLVLYGDYIWINKERYICNNLDQVRLGKWAILTSWDYFNINPRGWAIKTKAKNFKDRKHHLGPIHAKVLAANSPGRKIGRLLSSGHGAIAHKLGHTFDLLAGYKIKGDVMTTTGRWQMRGCFSRKFPKEYCILSPTDAAILNKSPLFTIHKKVKPVTRASRKWATRGVQKLRSEKSGRRSRR